MHTLNVWRIKHEELLFQLGLCLETSTGNSISNFIPLEVFSVFAC